MTNARIASTFERVADLLEQQAASPFRVRGGARPRAAFATIHATPNAKRAESDETRAIHSLGS